MKKIKYFSAALLLSVAGVITYRLNSSKVSATVPYTNTRVNLSSSGGQANSNAGTADGIDISKNGRYVAFNSLSSNLVSSDTNGYADTFLKDTQTGAITRVSVSSAGTQSTTGVVTEEVQVSGDGRYVVFAANGGGIVSGAGTNTNIYVHDMQTGSTSVASLTNSGGFGNGNAVGDGFDISSNGRYVVFSSYATNLVSGDTNGTADVFVRDNQLGTTTLLSKSDAGTIGNGVSVRASMSCDGSQVAFVSAATNLIPSDTNAHLDTFLVNRIGGNSITDLTASGNGDSENFASTSISCDGSTVLFASEATNLIASDTNSHIDIFAYDIANQNFDLVSKDSSNNQANANTFMSSAISSDGSMVAFTTVATNLVPGDTNGTTDVFLRNRATGATERVSMRNVSTQTTSNSIDATISPDGSVIGFLSNDTGLVAGDTNSYTDVFTAQSGTSVCSQ